MSNRNDTAIAVSMQSKEEMVKDLASPATPSQYVLFTNRTSSKIALLLSRVTQGETIEVLVGQERRSFRVHRKLLVAKSPFFESRLKECWGGLKKEPVIIEDLDPEGFEVAVDWMYMGRLPDTMRPDCEVEEWKST